MSQSVYCPNCGFDNRGAARFCKVCGASLAGAASPVLPPPQPPPPIATPAMFPQPSNASAWLISANGQRYALSAHNTLGRGPANSIVLADPSVSTQHATLVDNGGRWQLTDLNSRNHTWINRQMIASPTIVRHGDEVMLGTYSLRFETSAIGSAVGGTTIIDPAQFPGPISPVQSPTAHSASAGHAGQPAARGKISLPPQERQDQPPTDWVRTSITAIVALTFVSALLSFMTVVIASSMVLICLGGAVLIPILMLLWAPFQLIFSGLLSVLKDDKPVTVVNFQIADEISNFPLDVTFVRKRGTGGGLAQGDVVELWGKQQGGATLTASKLRVVERQGVSTSAFVPIKNPWPWWVLIIVLIPAVALIVAILPR